MAKGDANYIAEGAVQIWRQGRTHIQRALATASKLRSRSTFAIQRECRNFCYSFEVLVELFNPL